MVISTETQILTLEDWMKNPPEGTEWVDGELIEKNPIELLDNGYRGMTLQHSETISNLSFYWKSYALSSGQKGKVYVEVPCRTNKQGRIPDVAYLTPELVTQYGNLATLPQSFPLIAEIVSPTDNKAEEVFAKAKEYLESGCEEVWLVLPESRNIFIQTQTQKFWFTSGEVASTQTVLQGFSITVDELLA